MREFLRATLLGVTVALVFVEFFTVLTFQRVLERISTDGAYLMKPLFYVSLFFLIAFEVLVCIIVWMVLGKKETNNTEEVEYLTNEGITKYKKL